MLLERARRKENPNLETALFSQHSHFKDVLIYFNLSQVGIDTECISFVLEQRKDTSANWGS
jgi:hypothetical protein